ncbi:hypothetical protein GPECTOR_73g663 [Gonium pectorale]|uniref:Armadillo repeat-containing domain-containing protein n=1 Tax=Gonium pectorale TaxID=33097 RepID=A0A150G2P6_GONPE|nr:hypothetical protein GPECTOR_73g663 [Gonium pectorale]|eukprot:KXZ44142.1 hypothetical protein GPECTOR_73g663 [Gonium pectorale]
MTNLCLGGSGGSAAAAAGGDRDAQAALVAGGAGSGLGRMMSLRSVQALCHACDAMANLTLGPYPPAQSALSPSVPALGGLVAVSLGPSGQPLALAVKAGRALGNVCRGHAANQAAALQAGVMPVLAAWLRSRNGALLRAATSAVGNICAANATAAAAAAQAGALGPLLLLAEVVRAGAVTPLVRLVLFAGHDGVLRRSCHCLGTLVMGQPELQLAITGPMEPAAAAAASSDGAADSGGSKPSYDLPARLAALLRAASAGGDGPPPAAAASAGGYAADGGATAAGAPGGLRCSAALAAEVARLCGLLCFRSNAAAQERLAAAGVLEGLVGEEVVARAAYCAAVLADPTDPRVTAAPPASAEGQAEQGGSSGGDRGDAGGGSEEASDLRDSLAAAGLVPPLVRCLRHDSLDVAARGVAALEALVRGHRANALRVVAAGGIAALAELMERAGDTAAASAAGVTAAAAAAAGPAGAAATGGGAAAAASPVAAAKAARAGRAAAVAAAAGPGGGQGGSGHQLRAPAAAAAAASVASASATMAPGGSALAAAAMAPAGRESAAAEAVAAALWRRCVELWAALGGPAALVRLLNHQAAPVVERAAVLVRAVAEGGDTEAQSRLLRASSAAPLLRACRHRHPAVAEAAMAAVAALAACEPPLGPSAGSAGVGAGKSHPTAKGAAANGGAKGGKGSGGTSAPAPAAAAASFRAQLVDAGALGVLQGLQTDFPHGTDSFITLY